MKAPAFLAKAARNGSAFLRLARLLCQRGSRRLLLIASHTGHLSANALGLALAARDSPDFLPVFIGEAPDQILAQTLGIEAFNENGRAARALWKRAAAIAYTTYYDFDFGMSDSHAYKIALWHGMPIKGIGLLSPKATWTRPSDGDMMIATSEFTAEIMARSFAMPREKIEICGEPKTDFLPDSVSEWDWLGSLRKRYRVVIAYLPTWRDEVCDGEFSHVTSDRLRDVTERFIRDPRFRPLLERHHAAFVARMHPHTQAAMGPVEAPLFQMEDAQGDPSHLLEAADVIISDYSGLVIDALLFDKPLLLWTEDFSEYVARRPLPYFDLQEMFGWAMHGTLDSLFEALSRLLEGAAPDPHVAGRFAECKALFHAHPRGGAGERILEAVRSRMKDPHSAGTRP